MVGVGKIEVVLHSGGCEKYVRSMTVVDAAIEGNCRSLPATIVRGESAVEAPVRTSASAAVVWSQSLNLEPWRAVSVEEFTKAVMLGPAYGRHIDRSEFSCRLWRTLWCCLRGIRVGL